MRRNDVQQVEAERWIVAYWDAHHDRFHSDDLPGRQLNCFATASTAKALLPLVRDYPTRRHAARRARTIYGRVEHAPCGDPE